MTTLLTIYASIAGFLLILGLLLTGCSGERARSYGKQLLVAVAVASVAAGVVWSAVEWIARRG